MRKREHSAILFFLRGFFEHWRAKVLEMAEVQPHEDLKAQGLLVEFDDSVGNAAFISHQWLGRLLKYLLFSLMALIREPIY